MEHHGGSGWTGNGFEPFCRVLVPPGVARDNAIVGDVAAADAQQTTKEVAWLEEIEAVAGVVADVAVLTTATPTCLEVNGNDVNDGFPDANGIGMRSTWCPWLVDRRMFRVDVLLKSSMAMSKSRLGVREDQLDEDRVVLSLAQLMKKPVIEK